MPVWLTIEIAVLPFVLAALIWSVRLEMKVRHEAEKMAKMETDHEKRVRELERRYDERIRELDRGQRVHNDKLYDELRDVSESVHRIEGFLRIPADKGGK